MFGATARRFTNGWRGPSANSPTGCSPKGTCYGSRLRARRGGPVRGHPRAKHCCRVSRWILPLADHDHGRKGLRKRTIASAGSRASVGKSLRERQKSPQVGKDRETCGNHQHVAAEAISPGVSRVSGAVVSDRTPAIDKAQRHLERESNPCFQRPARSSSRNARAVRSVQFSDDRLTRRVYAIAAQAPCRPLPYPRPRRSPDAQSRRPAG